MYESTSGIEHHLDTIVLVFASDGESATSDILEEGSPQRLVRHIRVNLSKSPLADISASLGGKNISVLLLRGVPPSLATILDILHVVQGSLTSLDVALLPPPQIDPPGDVGSPREDKDMPSAPKVQPLRLQKYSCELAYDASQESPTMALIEWLVTSGSCAHLKELVVDVAPLPWDAFQEDFTSKFLILNKILRAAGLSLVRLDITNYPLGRHGLNLTSSSALKNL